MAYTITFDANGGICATSTMSVEGGTAIGNLPPATLTGNLFIGWYQQDEYGWSLVTPWTTFDSAKTVTARWIEKAPEGQELSYYYPGTKVSAMTGGLKYRYNTDGTAYVYQFSASPNGREDDNLLVSGDVVIPYSVRNGVVSYTVVAVGQNNNIATLDHNTNLTGATFPITIKQINSRSFYRLDILSSVYAEGVERVGEYAFTFCHAIQTISLPNLHYVDIYCFHNMSALEVLILPKLVYAKYRDLSNDNCLVNVNVPLLKTSLNHLLAGSESIESISLPELSSSKGYLLGYDSLSESSCVNLRHVHLPRLITIEGGSFHGASSLKSISLPSATSLYRSSFRGCTDLESISLPSATDLKGGDSGTLFTDCTSNQINLYLWQPEVAATLSVKPAAIWLRKPTTDPNVPGMTLKDDHNTFVSYDASDPPSSIDFGSQTDVPLVWYDNTTESLKFNISFDTQGGVGKIANVTASYAYEIPSLATVPTRVGYAFGGFYTDPDGLGLKYYNADGTSARDWDWLESKTLYAHWIPTTYELGYDNLFILCDFAANDRASQVNTAGYGTITVSPTSGTVVLTGTREDNTAIYSKWARTNLVSSGMHAFHVDGGSTYTISCSLSKSNQGKPTQIWAFFFTSAGVYISSNGRYSEGGTYFGSGANSRDLKSPPEAAYMSLFFYASCGNGESVTFSDIKVCKKDPYSTVVNSAVRKPVEYSEGGTYGTLAVPTRVGYEFAGWWMGEEGTGKLVSSNTVMVPRSMSVFSNWKGGICELGYDNLFLMSRFFSTGAYRPSNNLRGKTEVSLESGTFKIIGTDDSTDSIYTKWSMSDSMSDSGMYAFPVDTSTIYSVTVNVDKDNGGKGGLVYYLFYDVNGDYQERGVIPSSKEVVTRADTGHMALFFQAQCIIGESVTFSDIKVCKKDPYSTVVNSAVRKPVEYSEGGTYGTLAVPTRVGYEFAGWWTGEGGTGERVTGDTSVERDSISVWSKWVSESSPTTYQVTIAAGYEGGPSSVAEYAYSNEAQKVGFAVPSRTGYVVSGWAFTPTGGGAFIHIPSIVGAQLVIPGGTETAFTATPTWEPSPVEYTVSFQKNAASATGTMADQTIGYGSYARLELNAYSLSGRVFHSWNTESDGSGMDFSDGADGSWMEVPEGAPVYLYAIWKIPSGVSPEEDVKGTGKDGIDPTFDVPISPLPNQIISRTFRGFTYELHFRTFNGLMYVDVAVDGEQVVNGVRCISNQWLIPNYATSVSGSGNFKFSTLGDAYPWYEDFGDTCKLGFYDADDYAAVMAETRNGRV